MTKEIWNILDSHKCGLPLTKHYLGWVQIYSENEVENADRKLVFNRI